MERVTFHNPENGFCVLRVKARGQRDLVAVVGHAAAVSAGEFVSAAGLWTTDREHGLQFKALQVATTQPTTLEGIKKYLGSGMNRTGGELGAGVGRQASWARSATAKAAGLPLSSLRPAPRSPPPRACSRPTGSARARAAGASGT